MNRPNRPLLALAGLLSALFFSSRRRHTRYWRDWSSDGALPILSQAGDPEHGISRGRLLPGHHILTRDEASDDTRERLQQSLVLAHGGMAQNVGPILEMVTEKYLLRSEREWIGRQDAMRILDEILAKLCEGDIKGICAATTRNFFEPIQTIIP